MQPLPAYSLSVITASTALVASILGPFVTLSVARRQFRANVISTNRQKWTENLRERVSELLSLMNAAQLIKRHSPERWQGGIGHVANTGLTDKFERAFMALAQIRLMTSPSDPEHQQLNEALALAMDHLQNDELREQELASCVEQAIVLGRCIIRREWARVKRGV
jgi:hypothetical protein